MTEQSERVRARIDAVAAEKRTAGARARAARVAAIDPDQARKIERKARATQARELDAFEAAALRAGALPPSPERIMKTSARIERAATPPGFDAQPAWVVRFEGNSPVARLARPARPGDAPMLDAAQVATARMLASLHARCVRPPGISARLEPGAGGARGAVDWIDFRCTAWAQLSCGLAVLLPVERRVALEVVVYDTPIRDVARTGLAPMRSDVRGEAAIVQTLRLGLDRLALAWAGEDAA